MPIESIVNCKDPFDLQETTCPPYTYPFFGEDEVVQVPASLSSPKILLILCSSFAVGEVGYFLRGNEEALEKHCITIKEKLDEFAAAVNCSCMRYSSWTEYQSSLALYTACEGTDGVIKLNEITPDSPFMRLQILLPFFIEAATFIDPISDANWQVYLTIEAGEMVAFCTVYHYFCFPSGVRARISQLLVLPGHQNRRKGAQLYGKVTEELRAWPECREICVEEPTDRFERMRGVIEMALVLKAEEEEDEGEDEALLAKKLKLPLLQVRRLRNALSHRYLISSESKKAKIDEATEKTARLATKKWLLQRFSSELPEAGEERKEKLSELYEIELEEFILPVLERVLSL